MQSWTMLAPSALLLVTLACAEKVPSSQAPIAPAALTDREWVLVALGERAAPTGAGETAPTLRLDAATSRAAGFAGCNRFAGGYVLKGSGLTFGPLASTKMACAEGMDLEQDYFDALAAARTFEIAGSSLTLVGPVGSVARFEAR